LTENETISFLEGVKNLKIMGFKQEHAIRVLRRNNGNMVAATNELIMYDVL